MLLGISFPLLKIGDNEDYLNSLSIFFCSFRLKISLTFYSIFYIIGKNEIEREKNAFGRIYEGLLKVYTFSVYSVFKGGGDVDVKDIRQ